MYHDNKRANLTFWQILAEVCQPGRTIPITAAAYEVRLLGRAQREPHIPPKTAEIPFGIAAVFLYGCTGYDAPLIRPVYGETLVAHCG